MEAKTIRFTSLELLWLLFVMHALNDFSSYAHHGKEMNGNGVSASKENFVNVPKENLDGTTAATARKIWLGGRKMVRVHKIGLIVNAGNFNDASKKSFRRSQHHLNDQSKINMLDPNKTQDTAHEKDEYSQIRLLEEAANEMVNLMNKDYKGMDTPRRKPPINNHEPSH